MNHRCKFVSRRCYECSFEYSTLSAISFLLVPLEYIILDLGSILTICSFAHAVVEWVIAKNVKKIWAFFKFRKLESSGRLKIKTKLSVMY